MGYLATVVETPLFVWKCGNRIGVERRKDVRVATDESAHMKVLPARGTSQEIRVLDISRSGLKIGIPTFLPAGTVIQIHVRAAIAFAGVRYCASHGEEFHAGVRFQDVFWRGFTK